MLPKDTLELILATGRGQQEVNLNPLGDAYLVKPDGTTVPLAGYYDPRRIAARPSFLDAGSFSAYVNRFKQAFSIIFASITEYSASFEAVFDYHGLHQAETSIQAPARCAHRAQYTTRPTPEWAIWSEADGKRMNQIEFATWVEDNLPLFTSIDGTDAPTAGDLRDMVTSLHGQVGANYNRTERLQTGAQSIKWEEINEVNGMVQGKSTVFPGTLAGKFPLFEGGEPRLVTARLKTRVENRKISIYFETIGEVQMVRSELMAIVAKIAAETKLVPFLGSLEG